jgi:Fur family transcriptional regulator, ferric uptake regulator
MGTVIVYRVGEPTWSSRATAQLRDAGHRRGPARTAVIDFLDRQSCAVGAQEIHDELRSLGRPIGLASVYRVLETLAEHGLLQRLDVGDGVARFEPARMDDEHHHHLVCDGCGKVEPFADDRLEQVLRDVEERSGYAVAAHDVVLRGACTSCKV